MRKILLTSIAMLVLIAVPAQAKDLVAYFSAEGHTKAVAERIAELTGADLYRIEAADPYAANPYDDSDRIQNEAYNDLRPAVADAPSQEWIDGYDRIYVGSPCWWHQPAMVVCTFLEKYDLSKHVIIPFFTYGATTYLNESMQKIYKCTPNSVHVPATLPTDLDPDDITRPGRPDDAGIDMPGNARGVEGWLTRLGLIGAGVGAPVSDITDDVRIYNEAGMIRIELSDGMVPNTVEIYTLGGTLVRRLADSTTYTVDARGLKACVLSMTYGPDNRSFGRKILL